MNARQLQMVEQERQKLQHELARALPGYRARCVISVARNLLLQGDYFYNGRWCEPMVKSIGAGIYEVWLKDNAIIKS